MKAKLSMILALVPALTWGALCEDTFYLQSISETVLSGTSPRQMTTRKTKTVSADLSNLTIMHSALSYAIMVGFDGACTKAVKPVRLKIKASGQTVFTDTVDGGYQLQLYDSNTRVENFKYDYWFGFYKPAASLTSFIGMPNASDSVFSNFYAAVLYVDSVRDTAGFKDSANWKWQREKTHYYNLSGLTDSASLDKGLLDATGVRNLPVDANHKGYYSIQFLKVVYGNRKPNALQIPKRAGAGFQTNQIGKLVLIDPGLSKAGMAEPLNIYGMMGNKIATVHPTGYAFQWNGKTASGGEAPTGVYFVQIGNRMLGKFFYSH